MNFSSPSQCHGLGGMLYLHGCLWYQYKFSHKNKEQNEAICSFEMPWFIWHRFIIHTTSLLSLKLIFQPLSYKDLQIFICHSILGFKICLLYFKLTHSSLNIGHTLSFTSPFWVSNYPVILMIVSKKLLIAFTTSF